MAKTMIAPMTEGQIDTAVAQFRAAMRKHRDEVPKNSAQQVLGTENLGMKMFSVFRELAETVSNMIFRKVTVNRNQTPQEALSATGRQQYVDSKVVQNMPKGEGDEVEVVFFKLGRYISDTDLEREYEIRGLKPADPYSLLKVNEDDPLFADTHPNSTHWKDVEGKWCFLACNGWLGGCDVRVNRRGNDWNDYWWFAGLRK